MGNDDGAGRDYLLGSTDREHERLIYQATRLAPVTEQFFREVGIGVGHRVLDLGSGVGDVAMLLAKVVGHTLSSLLPLIEKLGLSTDALGDLDTLGDRLQQEVASAKRVVPWLALVSAWCRTPAS